MAMAELSLRPPRLRVSRRALAYWTVRAVPGWLVILGIEAIVGLSGGWSNQLAITIVAGTAGLAVAHLVVMPQWRYRVHRWERTSEAVYTQAGWFTVERRIAPISRIQTVDSHMGLWERIFSLSNVTITTASAAGPLHIHGLDRTTARALLDDLIHDTQASPGDAT
jgi:membrane protein YdbS with pleckstrin-like domain